jgi:hypothetical protein
MNFEQLPREITPPADLEDRTVAVLHQQGLLHLTPRERRGGSPGLRQRIPGAAGAWRRIAAAMLIFAAGAWVGAAWDTPAGSPEPGTPRFLLLLEGASTVSAADESRVFEEYRAWAGQLRRSGRFVSGERLGAASVAVPAGNADSFSQIHGYFVVSANDLRDAVAVAESSPHVARGGLVRVRPIDMQ